jgi:hypothetical protein
MMDVPEVHSRGAKSDISFDKKCLLSKVGAPA